MAMAEAGARLYEDDHHAWVLGHAKALRRLAQGRWNGPLDLENLAEEVEGLGKAERNGVLSPIERVIGHALELAHSASPGPRRGWILSIVDARRELARHLTPSLRAAAPDELAQPYAGGRARTARALRLHDEPDAAAALPESCPYTLAQLLDEDWFPANRHGQSEPF
jgi:Domain of unknown function DUF29